MKDYIFKHFKDEDMRDYKMSVLFHTNKFELILFQPSNAWRAELAQDELSILASQIKMDPEEYYSRIKQYLSSTPEDMNFKISNKELIMYQKLKNNIKMKLFFCPLEKVNYCHYVEKLLDLFYDERMIYKEKYDSGMKDQDELKQSKEELEKKLQEFVERKKNDDEVLCSNFVLVLNEKKRQIQHLNQILQAFKSGRPILNPPVDVKKGKKKDAKVEVLVAKEEVSDSDTDDEPPKDYNTDDDYDCQSKVRHIDEINNQPSTSKQDFTSFLDNSPPHHTLPKRQKITLSIGSNIIQPPSVSIEEPHKHQDSSVTVTKEETLVDNEFNTQDLLDLI